MTRDSAEIGALADTRDEADRGCCDLCDGVGGECWQCRGTGHAHAPDPSCRATPPGLTPPEDGPR